MQSSATLTACRVVGLLPRNVELAARSSDSLLERLGAIRRPGVCVVRFLYVPIRQRVVRRMDGELGREIGAAKSDLRVRHDHGVGFDLVYADVVRSLPDSLARDLMRYHWRMKYLLDVQQANPVVLNYLGT